MGLLFYFFWGEGCLFLAETGNILQSATLYLHFSAAKSGRKAVQGTTRPLTIPRREDFTLKSVNARNTAFLTFIILTSATALLLRYVHVAYGKIAARQARGYGVLYEVKPIRHKYYSLYWHSVNRTRFSARLAVAR